MIQIVNTLDDSYPSKLLNINNPPIVLYCKGNHELLNGNNSVAIIGTRNPTEHGMKVGIKLSKILSDEGYNIVSGLALRCDTAAHVGSLHSGISKTIAVLPSGVDTIYPAKNKQLAEDILKSGGLLVSEYKPGTKPFKSYFVDRNRLQSGLSKGTLIIESDIKSGTMHTANFTIEQERILACYDHKEKYLVEKQTKGTQMLIKDGKALSISGKEDINSLI